MSLGSHPVQLLLGNLGVTRCPRAGRPGWKASATRGLLHGTCGLSLLKSKAFFGLRGVSEGEFTHFGFHTPRGAKAD